MKFKNSALCIVLLILVSHSFGEPLQIHGFVSQGILTSSKYNYIGDDTRGVVSTELRELGFNMQKQLNDHFRVGIQILNRDVGIYANNRMVLDWAYCEVYIHDMLSISVGRNKTQLGLYTQVQDFDFLTPFGIMPSVLYDKGLRTTTANSDGIRLSGSFDFKKVGGLDYYFTLGTSDVGEEDIELYSQSLNVVSYDRYESEFGAIFSLIYNTPITGLRLLGTVDFIPKQTVTNLKLTTAPVNLDTKASAKWYVAGVEYQHSFFDIMFEYHQRNRNSEKFVTGTKKYLYADVTYSQYMSGADKLESIADQLTAAGQLEQAEVYQAQADSLKDVASIYKDVRVERNKRGGGYVGVVVKPLHWLNIGSYYQLYFDQYKQQTRDLQLKGADLWDPVNTLQDLALTTTFLIGPNIVIKLEGHMVNGTATVSKTLNPDNDFSNEKWQYGVVKVTCNF